MKSAPVEVGIESSRRVAGEREQAAVRLLDLALTMPLEQGASQAARSCVELLSEFLPDRAIGVCITAEGEQLVEQRLPFGRAPNPGRDPTRVFPEFRIERIVSIHPDGSTLHLARDAEEELELESWLAERVATLLRRFLDINARLEHGPSSEQAVEHLRAHVIQAEKLASLGQIVAGLVHELNNPLTSIVAYADFLRAKAQRSDKDPEDVERLRRIGEAAERILKFSRDLVAYARPSNEIPGPVDINAVIEQALVFCEHEFAEANVTVQRDLDGDSPAVRGVSGQLTQVFVNLFTNAAHAMAPRGGTLSVSTQVNLEREALQVDVNDEGVGISEEKLSRIFEPFYTTKEKGQGTGLGLAIVRDILTNLGGNLSAMSEEGNGSTFRVLLPLLAVPPSG